MMPYCKNCGKEFEQPHSPKKVYCDQKCLEEYKKKECKKNLRLTVCLWCRSEYRTKFAMQRFCENKECTRNFNTLRTRIYNIYTFDYAKQEKEIKRLEELGKFYTFPKGFEDLNKFYQLEGKKNE